MSEDELMRQEGNKSSRLRCFFSDVEATWMQVLFCVIICFALVFVAVDLCTTGYVVEFMETTLARIDNEKTPILVIQFILFGAVSVILLVPQTFLFVGAGYICYHRTKKIFVAMYAGVALSAVSFVLGATIAFSLGRLVLPPSCAKTFFRHFNVLHSLDRALLRNGRRMNILLRVNPVIPYNALNYTLGLSSTSLCHFLEGMIGALPFMLVAVYGGTVIGGIDNLSDAFEHTSVEWICLYGLLLLLCLVSLWCLGKYTAVEMEFLVEQSSAADISGGRGEDENGRVEEGEGSSTMFGTFMAGQDVWGDEGGVGAGTEEEVREMQVLGSIRSPLLVQGGPMLVSNREIRILPHEDTTRSL